MLLLGAAVVYSMWYAGIGRTVKSYWVCAYPVKHMLQYWQHCNSTTQHAHYSTDSCIHTYIGLYIVHGFLDLHYNSQMPVPFFSPHLLTTVRVWMRSAKWNSALLCSKLYTYMHSNRHKGPSLHVMQSTLLFLVWWNCSLLVCCLYYSQINNGVAWSVKKTGPHLTLSANNTFFSSTKLIVPFN